jgi:hypothetical protein
MNKKKKIIILLVAVIIGAIIVGILLHNRGLVYTDLELNEELVYTDQISLDSAQKANPESNEELIYTDPESNEELIYTDPDSNEELAYTDPALDKGSDLYETGPDEDPDNDGLTNAEELKYGTDINNFDTDGDGLTDFYEVKIFNTNPLKPDSDNDGLDDRAELLAGLNPNSKMTDGKTPDKERTFEVVRSDSRVKLTVFGNANVYNVYAGTFNTVGLINTPGLVSKVYEFYLETPFKNAEVTFNYTDSELKSRGIDEKNLSIFEFTNKGTFNAVNSIVDTKNNTVTAKLQHFSKYTLGDGTAMGL